MPMSAVGRFAVTVHPFMCHGYSPPPCIPNGQFAETRVCSWPFSDQAKTSLTSSGVLAAANHSARAAARRRAIIARQLQERAELAHLLLRCKMQSARPSSQARFVHRIAGRQSRREKLPIHDALGAAVE